MSVNKPPSSEQPEVRGVRQSAAGRSSNGTPASNNNAGNSAAPQSTKPANAPSPPPVKRQVAAQAEVADQTAAAAPPPGQSDNSGIRDPIKISADPGKSQSNSVIARANNIASDNFATNRDIPINFSSPKKDIPKAASDPDKSVKKSPASDAKPASHQPDRIIATSDKKTQDTALHILSGLLDIEQAARRADSIDALRFIIVNRSYELVKYDRSVLLEDSQLGFRVTAISNISIINRQAPFVIWLQSYIKRLNKQKLLNKAYIINARDLATEKERNRWLELAPPSALIIPLLTNQGEQQGLLVQFANDDTWLERDQVLLTHLCEAYAYCLLPYNRVRIKKIFRKQTRILTLTVVIGFILLAFVPIRQKVIAPAEITALNAHFIAAPLAGVIKEVLIEPNATVSKGDILFRYDDTDLRNRKEISEQNFRVVESKVLNAYQEAFIDQEMRAQVRLLELELEKARAELDYATEQFNRATVTSPSTGSAVYRDKNDLIGRPLQIGAIVMQIADPELVEISINLPVAKAIPLDENAEVKVFLASDPLNPLQASLKYHSLRSEVRENISAYLLRAELEESNTFTPRIGSKGTAHVFGERTMLFLYAFRRPISLIRQYLGI